MKIKKKAHLVRHINSGAYVGVGVGAEAHDAGEDGVEVANRVLS